MTRYGLCPSCACCRLALQGHADNPQSLDEREEALAILQALKEPVVRDEENRYYFNQYSRNAWFDWFYLLLNQTPPGSVESKTISQEILMEMERLDEQGETDDN